MSTFPLKIVTPDGLIYDGSAERLIVRSTTGDLAIMARHINFVTPLGMGRATVIADGQRREAACIGGMLSVVDGAVTLVPTTFEWADKIDVNRAEASQPGRGRSAQQGLHGYRSSSGRSQTPPRPGPQERGKPQVKISAGTHPASGRFFREKYIKSHFPSCKICRFSVYLGYIFQQERGLFLWI